MKTCLRLRVSKSLLAVALGLVTTLTSNAAVSWSAKEDFSGLTTAVMRLLQSGDAAAFADAVSPSIDDWRATVSTNRNAQGEDPLGASWQSSLKRQRAAVESSAKALLAKTAGLNVDFSQLRLTDNTIPPRGGSSIRFGDVLPENEMLPWAQRLEVAVSADPTNDAPEMLRMKGDYAVALNGIIKLSPGWRCMEGVQWASLPDTVADEQTRCEFTILAKVSRREGLTANDDPALAGLGATLKQFLQSRDLNALETDAMMSLKTLTSLTERQAASYGYNPPSQAQLEQRWKSQSERVLASARRFVELMNDAGVDLGDAQIKLKEAKFAHIFTSDQTGSLEGLRGDELTVTLAVESDRQSKSGKALSGNYVLAASDALRVDGRWLLSRELRWKELPPGVVDGETVKELEFENHVATYGTLPPNTPAPDIEFINVDDERKSHLSDLRGKVVILDFWATWCGPCQEPMAKMQTYAGENPNWKDRVAVVSLSIDDDLKTARNHLVKRGWTNTFNVWAGAGGWQARPAQTFRVNGVPTCYVINTNGVIVKAGHPMSLHAPDVVNGLLK